MIENTIQYHLFYPLLFILAIIVIFVITRVYKDKLDNKKDIELEEELSNMDVR